MKLIAYLKYFLFIARYWNIGLAWFTIRHEIRGERKYNIDTTGIDMLKTISVVGDDKRNASIYQGAGYYLLEKAFRYLQEANATGSLVDYGAGKGRIMVVAAHFGIKNIKGIEFAPALAVMAKKNIDGIRQKFPATSFSIIKENAVNYEVGDDDCIFTFFNPFNDLIMLPVVKNILASVRRHPRKIFIVYINPMHKEIFQSAGFLEEYYECKKEYLELSILSYTPDFS